MRKFIWLFLIAGVATAVLAKTTTNSSNKLRRAQNRHMKQKRAINTWENEGGPPAALSDA